MVFGRYTGYMKAPSRLFKFALILMLIQSAVNGSGRFQGAKCRTVKSYYQAVKHQHEGSVDLAGTTINILF